jgi:hypothetical protein
MSDGLDERVTKVDWPNKAVQSVALKETTDGNHEVLELSIVVLVPFKAHPAAATTHKAIGIAVPLTENERQALIAVLTGRRINGRAMDGENQEGKSEAPMEAHTRDSGNGRPRGASKKTRKV